VIYDLKRLPTEHPLRNRPLREIKAECRNILQRRWLSVATLAIGAKTFNELDPIWFECDEWRVIIRPSSSQAI
jgi:hypothetical protein